MPTAGQVGLEPRAALRAQPLAVAAVKLNAAGLLKFEPFRNKNPRPVSDTPAEAAPTGEKPVPKPADVRVW